ncbi:MAG TPA: hypothetical protein VN702_17485 [Acetobacteraceae bacterium]|nr:hypothetical protein [Acetobacteraceae bacterium]
MIDPSDIKAGAQFVVTVAKDGVDECGWIEILGEGGRSYFVRKKAISRLPTPSPTAEIDAEIVEAVGKLVDNIRSDGDGVEALYVGLRGLIDRRRALLKPKDAVGELLEAVARAKDAELPPLRSVRAVETRAWQELVEAAARVRKERGNQGVVSVLISGTARVRKERGE